LKLEKEEIENYKRQLRENARFKKELIQKSFENLKIKSKSPTIADNYKLKTNSASRLPDVLNTPKQFSH
jgi:hypothetical protein